MARLIEVKVNLLEFTYRDKRGYHTVVGYGKVPVDNHEVTTALGKGYLTQVDKEPVKSSVSARPRITPRNSSLNKNKEK